MARKILFIDLRETVDAEALSIFKQALEQSQEIKSAFPQENYKIVFLTSPVDDLSEKHAVITDVLTLSSKIIPDHANPHVMFANPSDSLETLLVESSKDLKKSYHDYDYLGCGQSNTRPPVNPTMCNTLNKYYIQGQNTFMQPIQPGSKGIIAVDLRISYSQEKIKVHGASNTSILSKAAVVDWFRSKFQYEIFSLVRNYEAIGYGIIWLTNSRGDRYNLDKIIKDNPGVAHIMIPGFMHPANVMDHLRTQPALKWYQGKELLYCGVNEHVGRINLKKYGNLIVKVPNKTALPNSNRFFASAETKLTEPTSSPMPVI